MHIFRHAPRRATIGDLRKACRKAFASGDGLDVLLAAGRLECGAAELWRAAAGGDGWGERERAISGVSQAAAAFCLGMGPRPVEGRWPWLPPEAAETVWAEPEGLRYYGTTPEGYAAVAREWRRGHADEAVWVFGLRTLGSVMAPAVAAAVAADRLATLRPVGAPDERRIEARLELAAALRRWRGAVLVVDEGPGLSGSSFGGTVRWLRHLNIEQKRISLLASWDPGAGARQRLSNGYAARNWRRWNVVTAAAIPPPGIESEDIGAGRWRTALGVGADEPVWGQHERSKHLMEGDRMIAKFGGLGEYGRATRERAWRLAEAGWGPGLAPDEARTANDGWIRYRRERARPLRAATGAWCDAVGRYLAWTEVEFGMEADAPPTSQMEEMARLNVERLLEKELKGAPPPGPRVGMDGRMTRVEWGERADGSWVKFDGTDHGDDPFFPGPGDTAWDLAAIGVEWGAAAGAAVAAAYRRSQGGRAHTLPARIAWHRVAYCGFRAAFCGTAAGQTTGIDRRRFAAAAERYHGACAAALADWTGGRRG
jgi:hypothetical protein